MASVASSCPVPAAAEGEHGVGGHAVVGVGDPAELDGEVVASGPQLLLEVVRRRRGRGRSRWRDRERPRRRRRGRRHRARRAARRRSARPGWGPRWRSVTGRRWPWPWGTGSRWVPPTASPTVVAVGVGSSVAVGVAVGPAVAVADGSGVGSADATDGAPTRAAETSRAPSARAPGRSRVVGMGPSSAVQDVMPETAGGPACSGSVPHSSTVLWSRSHPAGIPTHHDMRGLRLRDSAGLRPASPDRCVWVSPLSGQRRDATPPGTRSEPPVHRR